jgi:hypothetical protein
LINNTSPVFETSALTQNQSGLYFRVVISNGVNTVFSNDVVGNRIVLVTANPIILALLDNTVDNYPVSTNVQVGQTFSYTITSSLQNIDVTTPTNVSNIGITWQVSTDNGSNWTNISAGGNISITTTVQSLSGVSPTVYYKKSIITFTNTSFSSNLYQYRALITYTGASNTPLALNPTILYVNPLINIYRQPGQSPDTLQAQCYKTSIANSGKVKVQVGALTTAGTGLNYLWEMTFDNGASFYAANDEIASYSWALKPGTTHTSDVLEIEKLIFYNTVGFKCTITGNSEEVSIESNVHYVYMTDISVAPTVPSSIEVIEDRYGDIADRALYVNDPIQTARIVGDLVTGRNTGLNGDVRLIFQRKDPGTSVWYEVGTESLNTIGNNVYYYTQFPGNDSAQTASSIYTSPPVRISSDNGAKYRLKIQSSAIFTLSGSTKTLNPYYSSEITLNVFRTVYIVNQPANNAAFPNTSVSFSIDAIPSSGSSSDITYQWQYNTSARVNGWVNIPTGGIYSGITTNLLTLSSVSSVPTYRYFRCVVSISGQLSSVTSSIAELTIDRDYFTQITNLNDFYINQYENVEFTVTAASLSQRTIQYQWQKSTNYNPSTGIGTWTNITDKTTNVLTILSVQPSDQGYYRLRLTSFGGEVAYTNAVLLSIFTLSISITRNIPSSITVLEGIQNAYTFECNGVASNGSIVNYQWERAPQGSNTFTNIGLGFNQSFDNTSSYPPNAFDRIDDNLSKIRCQISANGIPNNVFTTECTVSVNRRFSYFADAATKSIASGETLFLNINPAWTGGTPSFMWQQSLNGGSTWSDINETDTILAIPNINSSYNNRQYRCKVTLTSCNQYAYTRNNVQFVVSASAVDYTLPVTILVVAVAAKPKFYSLEMQKTGAAIGTVIAVPKPPGYINDASAITDDINQWQVSQSGDLTSNGATSSVLTSGSTYTANKPSWTNSSYRSPKWLNSRDRFKGYIEMRGQFLRATEFPELARMFGTTYGGTITGTYPRYNSNDVFRMPNTYAKRLLGTGNINNNAGAVSVTPIYSPSGNSGGDKNIPGSMGGVYNYIKSAQLPPGSPGVSGETDGTADGSTNSQTFSIGTFRSNGFTEVESFVQPNFQGSLSYVLPSPNDQFTRTPVHGHSGITVGATEARAVRTSCSNNNTCLNGCGDGAFFGIDEGGGEILEGPYGVSNPGQVHNHSVTGNVGSFDIVREGGMIISDTTIRMNSQSRQLFDNSLRFYLRNNEAIPVTAPYFRLKYMIKAY